MDVRLSKLRELMMDMEAWHSVVIGVVVVVQMLTLCIGFFATL